MISEPPPERPAASFAELLRRLRTTARLTQEELAFAAGLSPRSVSDLERGISRTARKDTADRLADALAITGTARTVFMAAARGRALVPEALSARDTLLSEVAAMSVLGYPRDNLGFRLGQVTLTSMIEAITAAAGGQGSPVAGIWLIALTPATVNDETPSASAISAAPAGPRGPGEHIWALLRLLTQSHCQRCAMPARLLREGLGELAARRP